MPVLQRNYKGQKKSNTPILRTKKFLQSNNKIQVESSPQQWTSQCRYKNKNYIWMHTHVEQRHGQNVYLRTQIWNRYCCKNKSTNNVIGWRSALDVCSYEPLVNCKFYAEFKYLWIPENFNYSIIPRILLRNKVTETNALSMPKWNCNFNPKTEKVSCYFFHCIVF